MFVIYNIIQLLGTVPTVIDTLLPQRITASNKAGKYDKFYSLVSGIYFVASILFLTIEIKNIENTFDGVNLFWLYTLIGFIISLIIIQLLKFTPIIYSKTNIKYGFYFCLIFGSIALASSTASYLNFNYANQSVDCTTYFIEELSISSGDKPEYYVLIDDNSKIERFSIDEDLYNNLLDKVEIQLCTSDGFLNYKIVRTFNWV